MKLLRFSSILFVPALAVPFAFAGCGGDSSGEGGAGGQGTAAASTTGGGNTSTATGTTGTGTTSAATTGAGTTTGASTSSSSSSASSSSASSSSSSGSSSSTSSSTGGGGQVTYTADAQPIFAAHCGTCHSTTGAMAGTVVAHFVDVYADTKLKTTSPTCLSMKANMTVGECTHVRINNGTMPKLSATTNCATTPANPNCLTVAEKGVIDAWVKGGMLQ